MNRKLTSTVCDTLTVFPKATVFRWRAGWAGISFRELADDKHDFFLATTGASSAGFCGVKFSTTFGWCCTSGWFIGGGAENHRFHCFPGKFVWFTHLVDSKLSTADWNFRSLPLNRRSFQRKTAKKAKRTLSQNWRVNRLWAEPIMQYAACTLAMTPHGVEISNFHFCGEKSKNLIKYLKEIKFITGKFISKSIITNFVIFSHEKTKCLSNSSWCLAGLTWNKTQKLPFRWLISSHFCKTFLIISKPNLSTIGNCLSPKNK